MRSRKLREGVFQRGFQGRREKSSGGLKEGEIRFSHRRGNLNFRSRANSLNRLLLFSFI